ncbi:MAG: cupin domain-containing protein [Nanoarchaeota archaeon]|nr:cupin domain-containing protein [Nanoarchaeota archaeon]
MKDLIEKFKEKKVLVIGDLMLDKHIHGTVSRISPEAPVPVLKAEKESFNPGGAANLANNLALLGAKVYLAGTVGDDEPQKILFKELEKNNINTSCILKTSKPTIQKIRGLSHQHLFRIDYEDTSNITKENEQELLSLIKNKISEIDAIILSDYSKGTLTETLVKNIISFAKENNKLITADCKPINLSFYKNVDLIKPNKKEAIEMTLTNDIEKAGKILVEKLNSNVIITKGSEGFSIFEKNKNITHIPTKVKEIYDVSGAGDTVLAILTLSLISGTNLKEATELANGAASIVISKPGVTAITLEELETSLSNNIKTIPKTWGEEQWIVNNEKYCGKKMFIKQDHYCSYHMHKVKEETFYILEGELEIIHQGKYLKLKKGSTIHIKPNEYHSFRALQDTVFFEFSTQHLEEDNYRLTKSDKGTHEQWKNEIEKCLK